MLGKWFRRSTRAAAPSELAAAAAHVRDVLAAHAAHGELHPGAPELEHAVRRLAAAARRSGTCEGRVVAWIAAAAASAAFGDAARGRLVGCRAAAWVGDEYAQRAAAAG